MYREQQIQLPSDDQLARLPKEFSKLGAEVKELRSKRDAAAAKLEELHKRLDAAPAEDAEASATALRAGKKDPGTVRADKAKAEIEAMSPKVKALEVAVERAEEDLAETIRSNAEQERARLLAEEEKEKAACLEVARSLNDLVDAREATLSLRAWLKDPTRPERRFRMGASESLRKANGERMTIKQLLAEVTTIFEPPVPVNTATGRPLSETPRLKPNPPRRRDGVVTR